MPRPPLHKDRIVAAGVGIVSDMGLGALSVRTVARRLGAAPLTVQRVVGPTELFDAVVSEVLAGLPVVLVGGEWRHRARTWALATRVWLQRVPGLARHLMVNRWDVAAGLDRLEQLADLFTQAGLTGLTRVHAARSLYWYVLEATDADERTVIIGAAFSQSAVLAAPARWPVLAVEAVDYEPAAAEWQFAFGLDALLDGIEARLPGTRARPAKGGIGRRVGVQSPVAVN